MKTIKAPKMSALQLILMLIYFVGGCILIVMPNLPKLAGGLDLAGWILGYFGYIYVIIGCAIFAMTTEEKN